MKKYTFTKEERLCSKRLIDNLFRNGSSFVIYPFRVVYLLESEINTTQIILSVSKKRFKKAVDRNTIRRRMKESYRMQKDDSLYPFLKQLRSNLLLTIQYISDRKLTFQDIDAKMYATLTKLKDELAKKTN